MHYPSLPSPIAPSLARTSPAEGRGPWRGGAILILHAVIVQTNVIAIFQN